MDQTSRSQYITCNLLEKSHGKIGMPRSFLLWSIDSMGKFCFLCNVIHSLRFTAINSLWSQNCSQLRSHNQYNVVKLSIHVHRATGKHVMTWEMLLKTILYNRQCVVLANKSACKLLKQVSNGHALYDYYIRLIMNAWKRKYEWPQLWQKLRSTI